LLFHLCSPTFGEYSIIGDDDDEIDEDDHDDEDDDDDVNDDADFNYGANDDDNKYHDFSD